jgi:hypothetical protein
LSDLIAIPIATNGVVRRLRSRKNSTDLPVLTHRGEARSIHELLWQVGRMPSGKPNPRDGGRQSALISIDQSFTPLRTCGEAADLGRLPRPLCTHELADKNIWTLAQSDMQQIRNIEKE